MIKVLNLDSFDETVQRWFSKVETAAAEAAVGIAREAFEQILETSPQYSGDFVANWKVSKSATDSSFTPDALGGYKPNLLGRNTMSPLFQMGSTPAMSYARANAKWPKLVLGESIYLHNSAKHDHSDSYAYRVENGSIQLRPENAGASHVVARAVGIIGFTYHNISAANLTHLRGFGK